MAELQKGKISTIEGNTARVVPDQVDGTITKPLTIHASLRGSAGNLKKGTEVVYSPIVRGSYSTAPTASSILPIHKGGKHGTNGNI